MNNVLNLQSLAVEVDREPMDWSTISNHCGGDRELDKI
ncbi:class III lanthipeptide [Microbulbifer sp. EKSA005]